MKNCAVSDDLWSISNKLKKKNCLVTCRKLSVVASLKTDLKTGKMCTNIPKLSFVKLVVIKPILLIA